MVETRLQAAGWARILADLDVRLEGPVLVLGEGAADLADIVQNLGPHSLSFADGRVGIVSDDIVELPGGEVRADDTGLAAGLFDTVFLRSPWRSVGDAEAAYREAFRLLRPGGVTVAAQLDMERLMSAPADRYPSRVLYAMSEKARAAAESRLIDLIDMEVGLSRAGFRGVATAEVDEVVTRVPSRDYVEGVSRRGWRGMQSLSAEERSAVLDVLAAAIPTFAVDGEVVEREPWHVVRGVRPA